MNKINKDESTGFSLSARIKSFGYAFEGLYLFFRREHNALIHLAATIVVLLLCFVFPVSRMEVIALLFAVGLVWMAELFNTAIEKMMDFTTSEKLPPIKFIKDLSAAAVLVASIAALATGCLVFIPKL